MKVSSLGTLQPPLGTEAVLGGGSPSGLQAQPLPGPGCARTPRALMLVPSLLHQSGVVVPPPR